MTSHPTITETETAKVRDPGPGNPTPTGGEEVEVWPRDPDPPDSRTATVVELAVHAPEGKSIVGDRLEVELWEAGIPCTVSIVSGRVRVAAPGDLDGDAVAAVVAAHELADLSGEV